MPLHKTSDLFTLRATRRGRSFDLLCARTTVAQGLICGWKGTLTMVHSPQVWKDLATQLRADSIRSTTAAGSGHPTSSMSAADLLAVLLAEHFHYDFDSPHDLRNDRLIFSKGHAAPLLYSVYKAAGAITDAEMLTLRKFGSRIEGHPT